jgi:hypothetical protein
MRKKILLIVLFLAIVISGSSLANVLKKESNPQQVSTQEKNGPQFLLVKFKENAPAPVTEVVGGIAVTSIPSIDTLNKKFKVRSIERICVESYRIKKGIEKDIFGLIRTYNFMLPKETDVLAMVEQYKLDPNVESAWPNYLPTIEPNLKFFPDQFLVKFKLNAPTPSIKILEGIAATGIPSIDALNKKFGVRSIKKVFGGETKATAVEKKEDTIDMFGLLRLYKFTLAKEADILPIVRQYHMDSHVESAQPVYKAKK